MLPSIVQPAEMGYFNLNLAVNKCWVFRPWEVQHLKWLNFVLSNTLHDINFVFRTKSNFVQLFMYENLLCTDVLTK